MKSWPWGLRHAPSHVPGPPTQSSPSRPFQRTVTTHKDGTGHLGFIIKKGKVCSVVKGSSAARNGLLTNHYLCEIDGQNVIGMKVATVVALHPRSRAWEGGDCGVWEVHVCGKAATPSQP